MTYQHVPQRPLPDKDGMRSRVLAEGRAREHRRRNRMRVIGVAAAVTVFGLGVGTAMLVPWDGTQIGQPAGSPSATQSPSPTQHPSPTQKPSPTSSPDGGKPTWPKIDLALGGGFSIGGTTSDRNRDEAWAVGLLGKPEERLDQTSCGLTRLRNTVLRWGDFEVTILNEQPESDPPGIWPTGKIVGWRLDPRLDRKDGLAPNAAFAPSGISVGSTLAEARKAFAREDSAQVFPRGYKLGVFSGDSMGAAMSLDAQDKITAMSSGFHCGGQLTGTLPALPKVTVGGGAADIQAFADDLAAGNWDAIADKCWTLAPGRLAAYTDTGNRRKALEIMQGKLVAGQHLREYVHSDGSQRVIVPTDGEGSYACGYLTDSSAVEDQRWIVTDAQWRVQVLHELFLTGGAEGRTLTATGAVQNAYIRGDKITQEGQNLIAELAQADSTDVKVAGSCKAEVTPSGKSSPVLTLAPCAGNRVVELRK